MITTRFPWLIALLALLLTPFIIVRGANSKIWYDPMEAPDLQYMDVKYVEITSSGNLSFAFKTYGRLLSNSSIIGNIYLDRLREGEGVKEGDLKGADFRISFVISPTENACIMNRFDSFRNQWDVRTALRCSANISTDGNIVVTTPNLSRAGLSDKFGFKAFMWIAQADEFEWVRYKLQEERKATIDGKVTEYKVPVIVDPVGDAPSPADYRALYAKDDFYRLYFAIVPVEPLSCRMTGYGARIERYFFIKIDADLNTTNGPELQRSYSYICSITGRRWQRATQSTLYSLNPSLRREGVVVGDVLESYIYLGPVRSEIVKRGREFGLSAMVITRIMDRIPDKGWIFFAKDGTTSKDLEVVGPKTDIEMNADLSSLFKSFGSAKGTNQIILGGPAVNPSYNSGIEFLKSEKGYYSGINVNGTEYWVQYGTRDYAVVDISHIGGGIYITAAGVTRYGTRAALLWLANNLPLLGEGTYVLNWIDNGNGEVELSEIGIIYKK